MPKNFKPRIEILPAAQTEIWPPRSPQLSFVLYGGTAVALHVGHRVSIDFDFSKSAPLNKTEIEKSFPFMRGALRAARDGVSEIPDIVLVQSHK